MHMHTYTHTYIHTYIHIQTRYDSTECEWCHIKRPGQCVCNALYVYAAMYTVVCIYIHVKICVYMYPCTQLCVYVSMYRIVCICIYVQICVYMYPCTELCVYVSMYRFVCICIHVQNCMNISARALCKIKSPCG